MRVIRYLKITTLSGTQTTGDLLSFEARPFHHEAWYGEAHLFTLEEWIDQAKIDDEWTLFLCWSQPTYKIVAICEDLDVYRRWGFPAKERTVVLKQI